MLCQLYLKKLLKICPLSALFLLILPILLAVIFVVLPLYKNKTHALGEGEAKEGS